MKTDLTVIILNFNTSELLKKALFSLKKTADINLRTIVVDNASRDDSVAMVKKNFPEIKLIESKKNLGFAGGNNLALSFIDSRYVLFLNPDTEVPADTLGQMVRFMDDNPGVGISTCRVDLKSGGLDKDCHRGFPTPWAALTHFSGLGKIFPKSRLFNQYYLGYLDLKTTHEIDSVAGAFLLVRKEAADKLGYWDERFFFYGEDLDFCYRYKEAGWKVVYHPSVNILHYKGAASGIRKESRELVKTDLETKKKVAFQSVEAMRLFYKKHYWEKYPWILNQMIFLSLKFLEWKRVSRTR
jgi:GT2 family glycosyltransferase